jgi:hypothetical protein
MLEGAIDIHFSRMSADNVCLMSSETYAPSHDEWTVSVWKRATNTEFVVRCDDREMCRYCTAQGDFSPKDLTALIETVFRHYKTVPGNWRRHVGCWLRAFCQGLLDKD